MNYPFFRSPNFTPGRKKKIQAIVLHRVRKNFDEIINDCFNPACKESFHFVINKKARVFQLVKLSDTSWHAGWITNPDVADFFRPNPNFCSVGVALEAGENEGLAFQNQLDELIDLLKFIIKNLEIPADARHIVSHSFLDPKRNPGDPGSDFNWDEIFRRLGSEINSRQKERIEMKFDLSELLVKKIFRGLLNRNPNLSELDYYKHSDLDIAQITKRLIGTDEFKDRMLENK
ncbi:MAG: peptidoglycan recognition family protein [Patescibacteria group bacterium]|nr:N-acetylmuramoyl-L-alanine amidase [Patescibacteria group bacterium]